jgi:hypothetical protein
MDKQSRPKLLPPTGLTTNINNSTRGGGPIQTIKNAFLLDK